MTHDQERQYHEREHAGYLFQQRHYGKKADLDAILQAKAKREEKERCEKVRSGWQPIETAPQAVATSQGNSKFGARVLLACDAGLTVIGRWYFWEGEQEHGVWITDGLSVVGKPAHWMPLPEAPSA